MNRRSFFRHSAGALGGAVLARGRAQAESAGPAELVDKTLCEKLSVYLDDLCAWIMTLNVGSHALENTKDTRTSIFINGNFARVLLASHLIHGDKTRLDEALRWCDTFCTIQQNTLTSKGEDAGFWPDCGPEGNIYFGDAGTAAHALAVIARYADQERRAVYIAAMERMARFIMDGCAEDPQGRGRGAAESWVIREGQDAGALGCGYYKGRLSLEPYTIATATSGGAFMSELYTLTRKQIYRDLAVNAVKWLLASRREDGEIPYTLAGNTLTSWPLDTLSYCTEAFVATDSCLGDEALSQRLGAELEPTVQWLIGGQNDDGSWGKLRSADQQRSPRAVSLLTWYFREVNAMPEAAEAVRKYCAFLLEPANSKAYGVKELVRTSGFVGLTLADIIRPGCTF